MALAHCRVRCSRDHVRLQSAPRRRNTDDIHFPLDMLSLTDAAWVVALCAEIFRGGPVPDRALLAHDAAFTVDGAH